MSEVEFSSVNLDDIQDMLNNIDSSDNGQGFKKTVYHTIKDGITYFRMLPPKGSSKWFKNVTEHKFLPPDKKHFKSLENWDMEDPIAKLLEKYSEFIPEWGWGSSKNIYVQVIVKEMDGEGNLVINDPQIKVMRITSGVWKDMVKEFAKKNIGDFTNPYNGLECQIERGKEKGMTKYKFGFVPLQIRGPIVIGDEDNTKTNSLLKDLQGLDEIFDKPNQGYVDKVHEYAKKLEKYFISLKKQGETELPQISTSFDDVNVNKEVDSANTEKESEVSSGSSRSMKEKALKALGQSIPENAPDCFLDHGTDSSGDCDACPYEFQCIKLKDMVNSGG